MIEKDGRGMVGKVFGGIMVRWFLIVGGVGLGRIIGKGEVVDGVNGMWGVDLLVE